MKKYSFIRPDYKLQRNLMAFGYECDNGWLPIIEELFDKITALKPSRNFEVVQVKEKYAGLRVYVFNSTEAIDKLIDEYEDKSYHICEICGEAGEVRENHKWYKTLCDRHNKEWQENK